MQSSLLSMSATSSGIVCNFTLLCMTNISCLVVFYQPLKVWQSSGSPCIYTICYAQYLFILHYNFDITLDYLVLNISQFMKSFLYTLSDFDSRDFPVEATNAVECFKCLNYLLKQYDNLDTASKRKFLVQVLLLCATHNSKYFWTSEESISSSKGIVFLWLLSNL